MQNWPCQIVNMYVLLLGVVTVGWLKHITLYKSHFAPIEVNVVKNRTKELKMGSSPSHRRLCVCVFGVE